MDVARSHSSDSDTSMIVELTDREGNVQVNRNLMQRSDFLQLLGAHCSLYHPLLQKRKSWDAGCYTSFEGFTTPQSRRKRAVHPTRTSISLTRSLLTAKRLWLIRTGTGHVLKRSRSWPHPSSTSTKKRTPMGIWTRRSPCITRHGL